MDDNFRTFLRNAAERSPFFKSLHQQLEKKGYLSDRQIACVHREMDREQKSDSLLERIVLDARFVSPGDVLEIPSWKARQLATLCNIKYFFRNIEVVNMVRETEKAVQLTIKFTSKVASSCHVCGRDLDTEISRLVGIGPTCAERIGIERPTIATAHLVLSRIEDKAKEIGVVGPIWMPKSQVKVVKRAE